MSVALQTNVLLHMVLTKRMKIMPSSMQYYADTFERGEEREGDMLADDDAASEEEEEKKEEREGEKSPILVKRCHGEDAGLISHTPKVTLLL